MVDGAGNITGTLLTTIWTTIWEAGKATRPWYDRAMASVAAHGGRLRRTEVNQ